MTLEELLAKYEAGERDFRSVDLSEANLSGVKLNEANFSHANLSIVNLSGSHLCGTDFSHAQINVARLSGAYLHQANLNHASLNVANLIRADLSRAQLQSASLIRAELIRADLSRADLFAANLNCADLREASLRHAILRYANLNEANFRDSLLTEANLEGANLNNTDLSRTDCSGANCRNAEMRQANLSHSNFSGANLSGANLRWADLSEAKLSGANLIGADLSNANLTNASLVHTDLTQAKLIKAEWVGADLSGATLTGAKLYSTSRFGLKTEGMICEWIDLSPSGDRSIIQKFNTEESREFFNETPPTIRIVIDKPLDHEANFAIAGAYHQIAQQYRELKQPPSMEIGRRRTVFTFRVDSDLNLLPTAYMAILPFQDSTTTQNNIRTLLAVIKSENFPHVTSFTPQHCQQLTALIEQVIENTAVIKELINILKITTKLNFFQAPTQTTLTNSSSQSLIIHDHPQFGRFIDNYDINASKNVGNSLGTTKAITPSASMIIDFIKGFHYIK